MCFFVCLALPHKDAVQKLEALSGDFELKEATDWPIGKATRGNRERDRAFLITSGGCSCFISQTNKHRGDKHRAETSLPAKLESLIQSHLESSPSLSLLIHYAHGDISTEKVVQNEKRLMASNELRGQLSSLEADVRYVIKSTHDY